MLKTLLIGVLLVYQTPAFSNPNEDCNEVIKAFEETIELQDLQIDKYGALVKTQDLAIDNLREQRNEALKDRSGSVMDYVWPFLAGAATATVVIGIRR